MTLLAAMLSYTSGDRHAAVMVRLNRACTPIPTLQLFRQFLRTAADFNELSLTALEGHRKGATSSKWGLNLKCNCLKWVSLHGSWQASEWAERLRFFSARYSHRSLYSFAYSRTLACAWE